MHYEKPQIAPAHNALAAIQSQQAKMAGSIDNQGKPHFVTVPAYEADE